MHFHANLRENEIDPRVPARSLGSYTTRENATTGLLLAIGHRLNSSPGWVTREAFLPLQGIGVVRIENLVTGEVVSSSLWGCTCASGERDVEGVDRV